MQMNQLKVMQINKEKRKSQYMNSRNDSWRMNEKTERVGQWFLQGRDRNDPQTNLPPGSAQEC